MKRILALMLALGAFAQQSIAMGLADAARMALDHAPAYAAVVAARDAAGEDAVIGRAGLLPFIKGTGEFSHYEQKYSYTNNPGFLASDVVFNRFQFGALLVQPLFRLDRWAGYAKGKLASEIGELKLSIERQALLLSVANAYADVLVAQEDLAAIRAQEKAVSHLRRQASAAFNVGTATVNDALEAESRLDLVRADRIQAENGRDTARAGFESLTGAKSAGLFLFAQDTRPGVPAPERRDYWRDAGMHQALSSLLAEKKMEVAKQEVTRSFGQAMPGIDFVAGLSREKVTNNLFDTGSTVKIEQLGLQVEVPLYAGGATLAQIRKARKLQVKAEYELIDARRKAGLTATRAWLHVKAAASRIRAMKRGLISANKAKDAAHAGYDVGLRTIVELLDAQDRAAKARRDLVRVKAEYLLSRLQLDATVGKLDMPSMERVERLLISPGAPQ